MYGFISGFMYTVKYCDSITNYILQFHSVSSKPVHESLYDGENVVTHIYFDTKEEIGV